MNGALFRELLHASAARVRLTVEPEQINQLETYFDLLHRWNRTINLTALPLDPPNTEAINRLFVEPLAAARFLRSRHLPVPNRPPISNPKSPIPVWFDLGSGNGSPAIPMKIALSSMDLTMVESRSRKAAFLSEVIRAVGLARTRVENLRFEDLAADAGSADLITARAVRADSGLETVAQKLLRPGSWLALFGATAAISSGSFAPVEIVQLVDGDATSVLQISALVPRGII